MSKSLIIYIVFTLTFANVFASGKNPLRILYIFPHPDDESFGAAAAIKDQHDQGHETYLLTLTRGGTATERLALGLSVAEMGERRYQEMLHVKQVLGFKEMTVLDMPDGALQQMDPREIEKVIAEHIKRIRPDIIISLPLHGVTGYHDHMVTHAAVKRVYVDMREHGADYLKRLAFTTLPAKLTPPDQPYQFFVKLSAPDDIDCEIPMDNDDRQVMMDALNCYETYQRFIEKSGILKTERLYFEIYGEEHHPALQTLTDELP